MTFDTLQDLFIHELQGLVSAENQITKALPKMIEAANSEELQRALDNHLRVTEIHVSSGWKEDLA